MYRASVACFRIPSLCSLLTHRRVGSVNNAIEKPKAKVAAPKRYRAPFPLRGFPFNCLTLAHYRFLYLFLLSYLYAQDAVAPAFDFHYGLIVLMMMMNVKEQ